MTSERPASVRAVEMAMQPKLFISKFESEQLVLVHGWRSEVKDNIASLQTIIKSTTEQIEKSKFHQGQINYKIELVKIPQGHRQSTPPPAGIPAAGATAAAHLSTAAAAAGGSSTVEASSVAGYASERAEHHKATAVVLGVGNTLNGKNLVVGSVALELLTRHGGVRELWFVKSSGSTVRPTAPARILVIVDAAVAAAKGTHRCLEHLFRMLHPEKRGKVSVVIIGNNGGASAVPPFVIAEVTKECTHMLGPIESSSAETNPSPSAPPGAEPSPAPEGTANPAAAPAELPSVSTFLLEATPQFPNPTINDVPAQFTKYLTQFKTDFIVLTPPNHGTFSDATTMILLTNPKNHIVIPTSTVAKAD